MKVLQSEIVFITASAPSPNKGVAIRRFANKTASCLISQQMGEQTQLTTNGSVELFFCISDVELS